MEDYALRIKNISKVYRLYNKPMDRLKESLNPFKKVYHKEYYALNDVSFDVKKGECVGILGVNGAGKSTILKIITGVLNPTGGSIEVNGKISALLELGAGFNMEYTGIENIYLNGTLLGFTREEVDARLQDILDFADIGDFVYQPVKTYSSGMFVRLAFAVAINIDPEILIVDEALSVGDVFFQAKCYKKFDDFKKSGKTILLVTHSLSSVNQYCDRVVVLDAGKKLDEGEPSEMIDLYKKLLVGQQDEVVTEEETTPEDVTEATDWKSRLALNPNIDSYGNGEAEIIDFAIVDDKGVIGSHVRKGEYFTVKMKVRFKAEIDEPIFAFTIVNLQGTDVAGTNTMYEKCNIGKVKSGDIREVSFRQKMDIQGGEYLISFGCTGFRDGDFVVYHRLYRAADISIISDKNTVGFFDMNSEVTVR
jgi:teichoic acid transport system ATP-binding protein